LANTKSVTIISLILSKNKLKGLNHGQGFNVFGGL
jgi:hypothetical protein